MKALSERFVTALSTLTNESDPPPWMTEEGKVRRAKLNADMARAMIGNSAEGSAYKKRGTL